MIKNVLPILFAGAIIGCALPALSAEYVLVKDGVARCAIVLADGFTPPMEYGANDLADHLKQISGAQVTIYKQQSESDLPPGFDGYILITDKPAAEEEALSKEAFSITTIPGKPWTLRICGDNKRGAMYGCYGLLQDVLGCRWFTSTIFKIPKMDTIAVNDLKIRQKPAFEYREPFYCEAIWGPMSWLTRNRANGHFCNLNASVGGKLRYGNRAFCHTMFTLVPPDKYFAEHPEYFALVGGNRVRHTQLCMTHPDVLNIAIEGVKQLIKEDPTADIFSVSQMDSPSGACECENCQKIVREEGSESGPILHFVNALAAEIAKEYPDAIIDTLAYNYSQKPPKHVRPLPNVRIRLCLPWSCKAHPLTDKCGKKDFDDLHAWGKITDQLYIWDYNTNFSHYMLLHPSMDYTKTVFKIYKQNGVVGSFMQGSYQSAGGSFAQLKSYLCARLMWDPYQDADKIMDEYLEAVYGKSAPIVKNWIALHISPFNQDRSIKLGIYDFPDSKYLTDDLLKKSEKLLGEAYLASVQDPQALNELGLLRLSLDYTRVAQMKIAGKVANGKYTYNVTDQDLDTIDRMLAGIKRHNSKRFAEGLLVADADVLTREFSQLECISLENDKLRIDVLPEYGGKIIELIDKKNRTNLLLPPVTVLHKAEGGYDFYTSHSIRDAEFWGTKFRSSLSGNTLTLKGVSPAGREVTRQFTLEGNKLILTNTIKNTTQQPLDVQMRERGMYPIKSFGDIHISFKRVNGEMLNVGPDNFTNNWLELNKWYINENKPAGEIVFKLRKTTITNRFDPTPLEHFYVNNDMHTTRVNLELFYKTVTIQPEESVSFNQEWTIE